VNGKIKTINLYIPQQSAIHCFNVTDHFIVTEIDFFYS